MSRAERAIEVKPPRAAASARTPAAPAPHVEEGRMTLKLGEDAGPVKEVWIYRAGDKEPTKFVLMPEKKTEKKAEKKVEKKAEKKPDAADEQLEERRGLLRRMYEKREKAEDPEAPRLLDEMKEDNERIQKSQRALKKLMEKEPTPRASGIWY
jgi:hypothetical protein